MNGKNVKPFGDGTTVLAYIHRLGGASTQLWSTPDAGPKTHSILTFMYETIPYSIIYILCI